jgi:uncharacterized Zn ribbon protein
VGPVTFDESGALLCPECGHHYMHHGYVTVMVRHGEDGDGGIVTVCHKRIQSRKAESKELPGRRDAVRIVFICEQCHQKWEDADQQIPRAPFTLQIIQHKGQTFMEWL